MAATVLYWPSFFYVAHSITVNTNMNLFVTVILMLLCIGEYSVTSYMYMYT